MSLSRLQIFKSCFQSEHGSVATEVTTEGTPSLGPEASYLPGNLYNQYKTFRDSLTDLTPEEIDIINEIEMFNCVFYKKYFDVVAPKNFYVTYALIKIFKNRPDQIIWGNFKTIAKFLINAEYMNFVANLRSSGYVARKCIKRMSKSFSLSVYVSYARQNLIKDIERNLTFLERNFTPDVFKTIERIMESDIWWLLDLWQPAPSTLEIRQKLKDRVCAILATSFNNTPNKISSPSESTDIPTFTTDETFRQIYLTSMTSEGIDLLNKEMDTRSKEKPTFVTPEPGILEGFAKDLIEDRNRRTSAEYITPEEKQYIFDRNFLQWKAMEISRGTYMAPRPRFYSARGGDMGPYIWE